MNRAIMNLDQAALDSLNLAEMIWGRLNKPVMLSLINSPSPLQFADESVAALMVFAAAGQPAIIHSACSLGSTGPITIAGSLVISNATTLAGICLAQLINPGTPLVYGLGAARPICAKVRMSMLRRKMPSTSPSALPWEGTIACPAGARGR